MKYTIELEATDTIGDLIATLEQLASLGVDVKSIKVVSYPAPPVFNPRGPVQ